MTVVTGGRKASGLEWVGSIPAHWAAPPLGAKFEIQLGKMLSPASASGYELRPYLRNVNVQWDRLDLDDVAEMSFDTADRLRYALRPGDLLVCEGGEVGRAALWNGDLVDCYYQKALHRVRPYRRDSTRFLMYALMAAAHLGVFENEGNTSTFVHLTAEKLRAHRFPWPPTEEQRAIADYLDAETARTDAIVRARREQHGLLDQREFAMLSQTLVPPSVPMSRLRFMASIQSGLTVDAQRDGGSDAVTRPYLRVANVHADELVLDSVTEITVPRTLAERCTLLYGDVLMTEGGDLDKLGRGTMWRGELPGALHQNHVFAVRPHPGMLDPEYLALLTRTLHARSYFERTGSKTTGLASTSSEKIGGLPVPALGLEAQAELVAEVTARVEQMRSFRSRLSHQIDLLLERRQALITAAVTGQLEIPVAAA